MMMVIKQGHGYVTSAQIGIILHFTVYYICISPPSHEVHRSIIDSEMFCLFMYSN